MICNIVFNIFYIIYDVLYYVYIVYTNNIWIGLYLSKSSQSITEKRISIDSIPSFYNY